jgi:hypothetical protein
MDASGAPLNPTFDWLCKNMTLVKNDAEKLATWLANGTFSRSAIASLLSAYTFSIWKQVSRK